MGINQHSLLVPPGLQVRAASASREDRNVADEWEAAAEALVTETIAMAMAATTMAKQGRQQSIIKLQAKMMVKAAEMEQRQW
jgi:hypothetical protein